MTDTSPLLYTLYGTAAIGTVCDSTTIWLGLIALGFAYLLYHIARQSLRNAKRWRQ